MVISVHLVAMHPAHWVRAVCLNSLMFGERVVSVRCTLVHLCAGTEDTRTFVYCFIFVSEYDGT